MCNEVIETLIGYFKDEISNKVKRVTDGLIVNLANGTHAKIKVVCLS